MRTVYFWWSASEVYGVVMLRWKRIRMGTGQDDTSKLGIGPVIKSSLLFPKYSYYGNHELTKIPHGLRRFESYLNPYTELYQTYCGAWTGRGRKIKRPSLKEYETLLKRRKCETKKN